MALRIWILAVLFSGAFIMGTAEMLVIGMIDLIADGLGVSVAAAGALVTANALGLAIGGPLLTLATAGWDRRRVLIVASAAFLLLNLIPVVAPLHASFLLARILIGSVQGLFIAGAITTATSIATPGREGRAMGAIITGSAAASALGLPVGTLLGQLVGWRGSFAAVGVAAAMILLAGWIVLPSVPPPPGVRARELVCHALAPRVVAILVFCMVIFTAIQSALTYLVPYLTLAGVDGAAIGPYLAGYGVATTIGAAVGGRLADAHAARMLVGGSIGVTASLALLLFSGADPLLAWIAVFGVGLFGMGMAPSMQHRTVYLAGAGAALAAALPASAVNVGIAAGSTAGGIALDAAGPAAAVQVALLCAVGAVVAAVATSRLRAREDGLTAAAPMPPREGGS